MTTGTLQFKVSKVDTIHKDVEDAQHKPHLTIKVTIGEQHKSTKSFHPDTTVDALLNFDLVDITGTEEVFIEAIEKKKTHAKWHLPLSEFTKGADWLGKALKEKDGHSVVHVQSKWSLKGAVQKVAGESATKIVEAAKETVTLHPQRALATVDTHRPWFLRATYYYDTSKNVYNYTTSFRVIAPVARFGENTANTILQKITGKSLTDLDTALVAPNLNSLDNAVDATIQTVLVKLVEGQSFVIKTKNDAVSTASVVVGATLDKAGKVKDYTTSSVKAVAASGISTVSSVTEYTTSSVKSVATTSYNTVASVTDYTTTQVANVSSSAYGKVRGATVYVVSHVPYLGAKIRA